MTLPLKITDSVFVAGEWVRPSHEPDPVFNPATEEVIGLAPVGGLREVDQAIAAAREAFDKGPWPRMTPKERGAILQEFMNGLAERKNDVMRLVVEEAGTNKAMAQMVVSGPPMHHCQYFIDAGSRSRDQALVPSTVPNGKGGKSLAGAVIRREPVGVVAAITPYNFPHYLNLVKLFPALVTGNTVVLKPSPYTPYAALILAEVAAEVGIPRGVFSVITGGKDVGEMLTTDQRIDMVSFTGSDAVGSAIMAQAAPTLKRVNLELGGKSAFIVRGDADLDRAVMEGTGFTSCAGQGCGLTTRHIVHNSVRERYVAGLANALKAIKVGNPVDDTVQMGPLIRPVARDRVERYVAEGEKSGATLVTGGRRPAALKKGYFYEPTLFDNVDNKSSIAQDEIFGPVAVVVGFDSDDEAVDLANDSRYGLSGSIASADLGAAYEMACAIRTGMIRVNGGPMDAPQLPFGGYKRSGIGRENGDEGLNAFTELKSLTFRSL